MTNRPWTKGTEWTPVVVPNPVFESARELRTWDEARIATPRLPGEEAWLWMERIAAKAKEPERLPYREPGSDDGEA